MVVAVSGMADARRGAAVPPISESAMRAPSPWAAPLSRTATRILLAGGLTVAGWLLGAALGNGGASAEEAPGCAATATEAPQKISLNHHRHHHHEAASAVCAPAPSKDAAPSDEAQPVIPAEDQAAEEQAVEVERVKPMAAQQPSAEKQRESGHSDLLGGLLGGVTDLVGTTLNTTLNTLSGTVDTVGQDVLAPVTEPGTAPLAPVNDLLDPVLGTGSSASATVVATVPSTVVTTEATSPVAASDRPAVATPAAPQAARAIGTHTASHLELPAVQEKPSNSSSHAGGGGSGPGLPSAPSTPPSPATSISAGHDSQGGARQQATVRADDVTVTQLRLIGTSRDHEVDGAGREAALPTTSPD